MLALLAATQTGPATPPDPDAAATNVQIVLLGVMLIIGVLVVAIGLLVLTRFRRRVGRAAPAKGAGKPSPWSIAGSRAEVDGDDGFGGVVVSGDDDADPNDDTWTGAPPA